MNEFSNFSPLAQGMYDALNEALSPLFFQLENESHKHQRPGTDTHFKATIVSNTFIKKKRIDRHRLVNALCQNAFQNGLHALSLHLYTEEEWTARGESIPRSPFCQSKKTG